MLDLILPGLLALLLWSSVALGEGGETAISMAMFAAAAGSALLLAWRGRPVRFALGLGVLMVMAPLALKQQGFVGLGESDTIHGERSFFGVNRVTAMETPVRAHILIHGTTVHGAQRQDEKARKIPQTYYHPAGPLGQVFQAFPFWRFNRVGAVGLGTGAAACYARPGQDWTFFEIDPVVERIARDERFFTFLADCAPEARVVIGDARLSLQAAPDDSFDLLILDAFSSDAIPVHLLTVEAFAMYRRKLAPGGVIMVHISNRYLDLEPVLGRMTVEAGFFGVAQYHDEGTNEVMLRYPSIWVAMARSPDDIVELAPDPRWQPLRGANAPLWTDDYVNIVGALRRGGEGG
ncbi:MAG: fused MFS/spermidine synthase [Proteobacteria bacterium]|nr:fused MFS/spermidine synthase [Pseudomonadota bacterium]